MMTVLLAPLLKFVLPLVAGMLTTLLVGSLKRLLPLLDRAPALVKQGVVLLIATTLVLIGNVVGVQVDPSTIIDPSLVVDQAALEAVIAATLAAVIHNSKKLGKQETALRETTSNPFDLGAKSFDPGA